MIPTADAFFEALALLTAEWLDSAEAPLRLPTSTVPTISAVMAYTQAHLADVSAQDVCSAAGLSERSLRRQFPAATGMSWQQYRLASRILRAMAILANSGRNVLEVATEVGFDSLSGFNRAFLRLCGETPSAYRRRITLPSARAQRSESPGSPMPDARSRSATRSRQATRSRGN